MPPPHVETVNIEDEMKNSYLAYSMSVIVGRALPNACDGLKPVHRRALYSMYELGCLHNKPYKKSARIAGDCIGKYHPHGEGSVYLAFARFAQPWVMRYLLVDGQGNYGSVDGDPCAAMRYTEARLSKMGELLLRDIDKETVNTEPNYDGSLQEPAVLPSVLPNLFLNGAEGIAVGMATSIPPHNLTELLDGTIYLIKHEDATVEDLMKFVKGPDFPTGGFICGPEGIVQGYKTGRGKIKVRAKTHFEKNGNRDVIVADEIPFQVNKADLINKIAELVSEKDPQNPTQRKLEGISDLRDESDKDGTRIVIELKRDANPEIVLNNLF